MTSGRRVALAWALASLRGEVVEIEVPDRAMAVRVYDEARRLAALMAMNGEHDDFRA